MSRLAARRWDQQYKWAAALIAKHIPELADRIARSCPMVARDRVFNAMLYQLLDTFIDDGHSYPSVDWLGAARVLAEVEEGYLQAAVTEAVKQRHEIAALEASSAKEKRRSHLRIVADNGDDGAIGG
jgi:hypothetical protein